MFRLEILLCFGLACVSLGALLPNKRPLNRARDVSQNLYISNPFKADAGDWGTIELCEDGSYVTGIEVKYNPEGHLDETAINGIKMYCSTYADYHDTGYVTSSVGTHGDWYGMNTCTTDFVTGFRANVLKYQGTFTDDVAVEDFKVNCNYGAEVVNGLPFDVPHKADTYNFKNGTWSDWTTCDAGSAVCGLQTRYEDGSLGDESAICDMVLFCCTKA